MRAVALTTAAWLTLTMASPAAAAPPATSGACRLHAPVAAARSGIPVDMIRRVMCAASCGNPRAVSPKGAIGCMQIMPGAWRELSARYDLGGDLFDARRNMIGGAMYLAQLISRFGLSGPIAAYNAGPGRYERYIAGTAVLPAETIAYVARVQGRAGAQIAMKRASRWQEASLFLAHPTNADMPDTGDDQMRRSAPENANGLFPLAR